MRAINLLIWHKQQKIKFLQWVLQPQKVTRCLGAIELVKTLEARETIIVSRWPIKIERIARYAPRELHIWRLWNIIIMDRFPVSLLVSTTRSAILLRLVQIWQRSTSGRCLSENAYKSWKEPQLIFKESLSYTEDVLNAPLNHHVPIMNHLNRSFSRPQRLWANPSSRMCFHHRKEIIFWIWSRVKAIKCSRKEHITPKKRTMTNTILILFKVWQVNRMTMNQLITR